ncbi:helix-turn-helix transcriptional regulator [Streptomyces sp. WAC06614]|uniref:helix-turn-helix domain-containing protein n=1 Tax=Streptomyces sp. WAC06614 TaxID=2487416 RepID=UPI000F7684ED|nr:helix-turn-helix transcriptional regulator [Streptomyces sp. WAC06614]RSS60841.1 LuxR family transcriptional regulator [Streptomyces sp. WAC06614]
MVADALAVGDDLAGAEAYHAMATALFRLGRDVEAVRNVAAGIGRARRHPHAGEVRLRLLADQADGHTRLDQPRVVASALGEARALARRDGGALGAVEARIAEYHYRFGRWDECLVAAARATEAPGGEPWVPVVAHGLRALVLGHRGEEDAAAAALDLLPPDAFESAPTRRYRGHALLARARLAEVAGRPTDALHALLPVLGDDTPATAPADRPWLLAELVRLALETGDTASARAAVAACEGEAAHHPASPGTALAALRCRGLFAQDPQVLAEAVERAGRGPRPLARGQLLEDLAVSRAWAGDLAGARQALADAVGAYEGLGAVCDAARADARLRRLGVRRGSRGARRQARHGWEALTPAELRVARLLAEGRSNPEIAAALFLSRRTVQTHVSHILGKLQVRTRAQVAAQAARAGFGP